jgi:hypothetical protein
MTLRTLPDWEFDSFSVATGTALVAGALSVVAPFLYALSVTLVVLAVAGWVALVRRERGVGPRPRPTRRAVALGVLGLGVVLVLSSVILPVALHGLVLPAALVPLWVVERGRPARRRFPRVGP